MLKAFNINSLFLNPFLSIGEILNNLDCEALIANDSQIQVYKNLHRDEHTIY